MFNWAAKDVDNQTDYVHENNIDFSHLNQGLGPLLVLYVVFKLLEERKISIDDVVDINETALNEKGRGVVGYETNDQLTLLQVLTNYKVTAGVDSLFLLAGHISVKTKKRMSDYFNEFIKRLNLSELCAKNLSGKPNSKLKQSYTLKDVILISEQLSLINPFYLDILSQSKISFKGKIFLAQTFLLDQGQITYFFNTLNIAIAWKRIDCNNFNIVVLEGVNHVFQQDSLIERILLEKKIRCPIAKDPTINVQLQKPRAIINIIGDTYLGEYYTERRRKRNVFDPLLDRSYDYSFEKLRSFLLDADLNIANHEACFINSTIESPLTGLKKFILGANDENTVAALKNANIRFLSLANNHTADYGSKGIEHTLSTLKNAEIEYFGAGLNEYEACKPIRIRVNNKVISFYAGYWHRATNQKIFKFYATPSLSGVATLESMLSESIREEKKHHPDHLVIVVAHWGVDFLPTQNYQKLLAKSLFENGADLIIGHGAHTLQTIEEYAGKTVLYSIGNGIFNSDGEYDGYPNALPFGMVAQLVFENSQLFLRLLPIESNNRETMWQPNFVQLDDFKTVEKFFSVNDFNHINKTVWPYYFEKKVY